MIYYTIYKVTNKINGKFYIGKHQTSNINDSYYGSGRNIVKAIKKYGKENFYKEILFVFDTEQEMNSKEKEILTEEFISSDKNYNLGIGGEGGPHFKGRTHSPKTKEKLKNLARGKKLPEEAKNKISAAHKGKITSQETKDKISASRKKSNLKAGKISLIDDINKITQIQSDYDAGLSLRDLVKKYKTNTTMLNKARKSGLLKTRDIRSAMKVFCNKD